MKFYLAGKWADKETIIMKAKTLIDLGHNQTHDWTKNESKTRDDQTLGQFAELDINGVKEADVYIGYINDHDYDYRGTYTELGAALGLGKRSFLVEDLPPRPVDGTGRHQCQKNCFYFHPRVTRIAGWDNFLKLFQKEACDHLRNSLVGLLKNLNLEDHQHIRIFQRGTILVEDLDHPFNLEKLKQDYQLKNIYQINHQYQMMTDPNFENRDHGENNQVAFFSQDKTLEEAYRLFQLDLEDQVLVYDSRRDLVLEEYEPVMYLLINQNLKMSPGKVAAQIGHLVHRIIQRLEHQNTPEYLAWYYSMIKKVTLKIPESEIENLLSDPELKDKLEFIQDAGLTQVQPGSLTVLGIGPILRKDCPEKLKGLKLY